MSDLPLQGLLAEGRPDRVNAAIKNLRRRLRRSTDDPVRLELLEDDLREGRRALEEVEAFFDDALDLLAQPDARGTQYVDLADDLSVVDRLQELSDAINNLRRRLLQLSAR